MPTGSYSLTINGTSGGLSHDASPLTYTATAVNTAPVANDDVYTTHVDTGLTVAAAAGVLANDTDLQGDALTAVLVGIPAHGGLALNADGSFSYTPIANYSGPDSFTYKANDGSLDSNVATVTLTVTKRTPTVTWPSPTAVKGTM